MEKNDTPTKEEVEDLQQRVNGYNKEHVVLLEKWGLVHGAQASLTPDGRVFSQPVVIDAKLAKAQAEKASPKPSIAEG